MKTYTLDRSDNDRPPSEAGEAIVAGLNDSQQAAVLATQGPVLIIAGPGSGKTRTLTHRVAYLIARGLAWPSQVLALTFTNKAAREMKDRIRAIVGDDRARGIWMGTFHSIFARVLRFEGSELGYTSDFSIYDSDDQERVLRGLMEQYNVDSRQYSPRSIRSMISGAKNQMISPSEYQQLASTPGEDNAARLFRPYQDALRQANALDFDDLLLKPIELFTRRPDLLEQYQDRWHYVHIDEYQDTNHAQYRLAMLLAARHRNICVVGDDAQSIYAFRGADIANILSFQRHFEDASVIRLEQNYRSTQKILNLAQSVIRGNRDQLEKKLWTENGAGADILLLEAASERDEAQKVERIIRDLNVRGHQYKEMAVLYRTNAQSRSFEDALRKSGIPYRVYGGVSFYQRREIKDVLAYLRLVVNPHDEASFRRVINYPTRGIGKKTLDTVIRYAADERISLWEAATAIDSIALPARARTAVRKFTELVNAFAERSAETAADVLARDLIEESGLFGELRKEHTTENLVRWENVQELVSAIAEFVSESDEERPSLASFLQEVSLYTDQDQEGGNNNTVTLLTLHSSKGLEFPVVVIAGLEDGLFPLSRTALDRKELEEERRLFYVGVTRAKERLFLSCARSRYRFGETQPAIRSRFLDEIEEGLVTMEAGNRFQPKPNRFMVRRPGYDEAYDDVDPHYYRKSLQEKKTRAGDGDRRVVYEEGEGGDLLPGVRVEHHLFGEGRIVAVDGAGAQAKATVDFDEVGEKKLVLRFARLNLIG